MAGVFDWARYVTGQTDDPEQDLGQWINEQQAEEPRRDRHGRQRQPFADAGGRARSRGEPLRPQWRKRRRPFAWRTSRCPSPGRKHAASQSGAKRDQTPISLGHLMMNLQQYNEREQGFDQALGAGFAAMSQPRDREWVSHIFNVTPAIRSRPLHRCSNRRLTSKARTG